MLAFSHSRHAGSAHCRGSLNVRFESTSDVSSAPNEPSTDRLDQIARTYFNFPKGSKAVSSLNPGGTVVDPMAQFFALASEFALKRGVIQWNRVPISHFAKSQWLEVAEKEVEELSFSEIKGIITNVSEDLSGCKFYEISTNLKMANLKKMCPDALVAITRSLYPERTKISGWNEFVSLSREELLRRGEPEDLMAGLL